MQVVAEIASIREQVAKWRREEKKVAFVPTMGHLHDGHMALVRKARELADHVIVSIFVNPMQFEKADDLNSYPRTLDEDVSLLNTEGVELVFTPTPDIMYPQGLDQHTAVEVPGLSSILEGQSRPGHFRGVATVVTKLFNIVQPDVACFGEKDFQQLALIRKMTDDLALPIEIVGLPTVREMDGLAMSSRNSRLTVDERQRAPVLAKTLRWISSQLRGGRTDYSDLVLDAYDQLRAAGLEPDEIFIRDAVNLQLPTDNTHQLVILAAAFLGQVRLIDNLVIDTAPAPTADADSSDG